ncbi:MAG: uroporphyrinogen-III C-methyltransferase [Bryobacterales bacterium]|nr:uroporphyrinogen-III C-methyltransferase [Bryobacterales bacterium]
MKGRVYLVGAGPGDPELITVKGRELLAHADVVLYDNLAAPELLPNGAELIYVGKKKSEHSMPQSDIIALLIEHARAGRAVVRLKGGDPYIFGRGGEEAESLTAAGVEFEVVPGVTAALGIAAYAGVPLTHRDHTSSVTFVTGHDPDKIDWSRIGHSETLVVYMGLTTIGVISEKLIAAGRDPSTPAVVVRRATTPSQQTFVTSLSELPRVVRDAQLRPPATIVIGQVAALRGQFDWFEKRPLFGQTVLVTRAEGQGDEGNRQLRHLGANVLDIPVIEIQPPEDGAPLTEALNSLPVYDWILFTSANAVTKFFDALFQSGRDARAIRAKIGAIGAKTAAALHARGIQPERVAEQAIAEGVVAAFAKESLVGARVLLPRAAVGRDVIPVEFRKRGARVDIVPVYRTGVPQESMDRLAAVPHVDWVTFTSSSTVKNFLALGGRRLLEAGAKAVSIGPATSETLKAHGIEVALEAAEHTMDGVIAAIRS